MTEKGPTQGRPFTGCSAGSPLWVTPRAQAAPWQALQEPTLAIKLTMPEGVLRWADAFHTQHM